MSQCYVSSAVMSLGNQGILAVGGRTAGARMGEIRAAVVADPTCMDVDGVEGE